MSQIKISDASQYAQAIYELALEEWQKTLQIVQTKVEDGDLAAQLDNTDRSFKERQQELEQVLPEATLQQIRNFLYMLLQNGHIHMLGQVTTHLTRLSEKGPGIEIITVTAAIALNDAEKEQFRAKFVAQHGDNIEVDFKVDPTLLGGVVVQIGDEIIDGSVASKLDNVREKLIRA